MWGFLERVPKDAYHADHCPSVCYTYSHVVGIFRYAKRNVAELSKITITQNFVLKPQCPRCSHTQGGQMKEIKSWSKSLDNDRSLLLSGPEGSILTYWLNKSLQE